LKVGKALVFLVTLAGPTTQAQNADVTFFAIGKHGNYSQTPSGERESVDYSFFSEIFLTASGDASDATLKFPTNELVAFRDMREVDGGSRDNIFLISGEDRFSDYPALQDRYPDGEYRVSFSTPSGSVRDGALLFEDRDLPAPPAVSLQQGADSKPRFLAPGVDVIVSWTKFAEGRPDPNGILDDLIFVILTSEDGERVAHSGRPFEGRAYLTYADKTFTINGDVLLPGSTYTLSVEHALLDDTIRFDGVPGFTTRAVTTKLQFVTATLE
jgi:hypothetical protein